MRRHAKIMGNMHNWSATLREEQSEKERERERECNISKRSPRQHCAKTQTKMKHDI